MGFGEADLVKARYYCLVFRLLEKHQAGSMYGEGVPTKPDTSK